MKRTLLFAPAIFLAMLAGSCTSTDSTTTTSDSTTTTASDMQTGDSAVTTTTTTTVVHHKYVGSFAPQPNRKYLDLRTNKQVTVRIDTVRGLVNTETDQPIDLVVDPAKHDTIYGQTGNVVNYYIIHEGSDYRVDETKMNDNPPAAEPAPVAQPEPATRSTSTPSKVKITTKDGKTETKIKE
ncbi:MAG: hypothetical protein V4649_07045 [Bacteroidota bacterium]